MARLPRATSPTALSPRCPRRAVSSQLLVLTLLSKGHRPLNNIESFPFAYLQCFSALRLCNTSPDHYCGPHPSGTCRIRFRLRLPSASSLTVASLCSFPSFSTLLSATSAWRWPRAHLYRPPTLYRPFSNPRRIINRPSRKNFQGDSMESKDSRERKWRRCKMAMMGARQDLTSAICNG